MLFSVSFCLNVLYMGKLLDKLVSEQRHNVPQKYRLSYSDLQRIAGKIDGDILDNNACVMWNGYVYDKRSQHISFYFRNKKMALNRILYINFCEDLTEANYLKSSCKTLGCCNIKHITKHRYNIKKKSTLVDNIKKKVVDKNRFVVEFFN